MANGCEGFYLKYYGVDGFCSGHFSVAFFSLFITDYDQPMRIGYYIILLFIYTASCAERFWGQCINL